MMAKTANAIFAREVQVLWPGSNSSNMIVSCKSASGLTASVHNCLALPVDDCVAGGFSAPGAATAPRHLLGAGDRVHFSVVAGPDAAAGAAAVLASVVVGIVFALVTPCGFSSWRPPVPDGMAALRHRGAGESKTDDQCNSGSNIAFHD